MYPRTRPNARMQRVEPDPAIRDVVEKTTTESGTQTLISEEAVEATPQPVVKSVPWFMEYNKQFEAEYPLERRTTEPLPVIPDESPPILSDLAKYMTQDLLLKDLSLLDLRNRENPWGNDTILLLGTARSERQLRSAAESLKGYLRNQGCRPRVDGLIKWENTKVKRRRRRKMIGRANYQIEDDRLHWLIVDVGGDTGIILQLFSEEGRQEYALEELWQSKANNDVVIPAPTEDRSVPVGRAYAPSTEGAGTGPLSRRMYSTAHGQSPLLKRQHSGSSYHGLYKQGQLLLSESNDPYLNLAYEHFLFQNAEMPCMLLYRNRKSVVIGRNQNPWVEANLSYLATHDIELVRRYSGGGAVYHDLGNTNYSYMMPRHDFDRDATALKIIAGLTRSGVSAALNERHDITVNTDGTFKKCSGSAYKISKDRAYAHGTMLLTSDLANLGPALRAGDWGIKANGVESVRSAVTNIGMGHEDFCALIAKAFNLELRSVAESEMLSLSQVSTNHLQLSSNEWRYQQTPGFTQTIVLGARELVADVKHGCYSKFFGHEHLPNTVQALLGQKFEVEKLSLCATKCMVKEI